jgi:hypothetical protein
VTNEFEVGLSDEVPYIFFRTTVEIVDADNIVAFVD